MKYFSLALMLALCGCDFWDDGKKPAAAPDPTQIAIIKMQTETQMNGVNALKEVQLAVVRACIEKGMVPVMISGNIDCKAVK